MSSKKKGRKPKHQREEEAMRALVRAITDRDRLPRGRATRIQLDRYRVDTGMGVERGTLTISFELVGR